MAIAEINEFLKLVPAVRGTPHRYLWSSYDAEADVLYINFKKASHATDSEMMGGDMEDSLAKLKTQLEERR